MAKQILHVYYVIIALCAAIVLPSYDTIDYGDVSEPITAKIKGVTLVAPPRAFSQDVMSPLKSINADWVALVPYGFNRMNNPSVGFNSEWQWWGERPDGIRVSIKAAKKKGLKVMVKPQVYIPGGWVGDTDYKEEAKWKIWEESYKKYILAFAEISAQEGVDLFCIGTEYKIAAQKREKYWRNLIAEVRSIFRGPIIYSSNWDGYEKIPFWDALDYIGLSAYFPLTNEKTPSVNHLIQEWTPIVKKLKRLSKKHKRKIIFTEYGYLSVDYCADKNWLLEKKINQLPTNEVAQANAFTALYATFEAQDFWYGGFIWKWFPEMQGHEGYPQKDYTPQGKIAQEVITKWYAKI